MVLTATFFVGYVCVEVYMCKHFGYICKQHPLRS